MEVLLLPFTIVSSEQIRNEYGINTEQIRNKFRTISNMINSEPSRNNALIQDHFESFMAHLQRKFGITSEKKIPNPTKALLIIVLFPEATAEQIGEILGVSSRSAETYIQKLKAEGILERKGGKKEGNWKIKMMN